MTKYNKINLLNAFTIIATIVFGNLFRNSLPSIIPTKFNESGEAIKFAPLIASIYFIPFIEFITLLVLTFLAKTNKSFWEKESNKEAVAQINLGILFLLSSIYIGTFLNAYNLSTFFKYSYFSIGFGAFFVVSAKPMKAIEKNMLYGIRLPWTMKSELNWKMTHELTSKIMLYVGLALVVIGLMTKNHTLILSLIFFSFLIPTVYSFKNRTKF